MSWEAMSWKEIPEGWTLGAKALINQFKVACIYQNTSNRVNESFTWGSILLPDCDSRPNHIKTNKMQH
jgi:hypothetical protein